MTTNAHGTCKLHIHGTWGTSCVPLVLQCDRPITRRRISSSNDDNQQRRQQRASLAVYIMSSLCDMSQLAHAHDTVAQPSGEIMLAVMMSMQCYCSKPADNATDTIGPTCRPTCASTAGVSVDTDTEGCSTNDQDRDAWSEE